MADLTSAAELINSVKPFRLLIKPQSAADLKTAIEEALETRQPSGGNLEGTGNEILNHLHVGVMLVAENGRVRTTNETAASVLGLGKLLSIDGGGMLRAATSLPSVSYVQP